MMVVAFAIHYTPEQVIPKLSFTRLFPKDWQEIKFRD